KMGSVSFHVSKHEGQALPSDAYYTTYVYHMSITFFKISKKIFDFFEYHHSSFQHTLRFTVSSISFAPKESDTLISGEDKPYVYHK
ncbi:MAG: hypothetical protein J6X66_04835, partial [Lachnospiraceae bacterium]|nr:hypothetical protein [Lachnospiraceae bacterium]